MHRTAHEQPAVLINLWLRKSVASMRCLIKLLLFSSVEPPPPGCAPRRGEVRPVGLVASAAMAT
eukprot:COSAG01_NODE_860_length_13064_cov_23.466949_18_plen_64_part_00